MAADDEKPTLVHSVPSFDNPFKPQLQHHVTDIKPFSFESQTQEMKKRRQQHLEKVKEEEEEVVLRCYSL